MTTTIKRGFIWLSKAWYGSYLLSSENLIDIITIGFYAPDGHTPGAFSIEWHLINDNCIPRLCAFNNSWQTLLDFRDVLEKLANVNDENPSPDEICKILESCNIANLTKTNMHKGPYYDD